MEQLVMKFCATYGAASHEILRNLWSS